MLVERYLNPRVDVEAERLGIEAARVTLNDPAPFHVADASRTGGFRKAHTRGERGNTEPPISLQFAQNAANRSHPCQVSWRAWSEMRLAGRASWSIPPRTSAAAVLIRHASSSVVRYGVAMSKTISTESMDEAARALDTDGAVVVRGVLEDVWLSRLRAAI